MAAPTLKPSPADLGTLLRGESEPIIAWSERWEWRRLMLHVSMIIVGAGLYGVAVGWWRDPQQALYTAIKLPLIILLTTAGNAFLNAMLAPLLGLNIPMRQSFMSILMSFAIAAVILGSFSPLIGFLIWNAPSLSAPTERAGGVYSFILLTHVAVIAFAGIAANLRLIQLLRELSGNVKVARRVLLAWLAGNLFFGSQLSWILRPFIGSPGLPVEFLRETAFKGSFYEAVFHSFLNLIFE